MDGTGGSEEDGGQGTVSGRDDLRRLLGTASPFVTAAITVAFGALEDRGLVSLGSEYGQPLLFGNAALAVAGTAACCVLAPGAVSGRAAMAVGCGALSLIAYAAAVFFGAFAFLDL